MTSVLPPSGVLRTSHAGERRDTTLSSSVNTDGSPSNTQCRFCYRRTRFLPWHWSSICCTLAEPGGSVSFWSILRISRTGARAEKRNRLRPRRLKMPGEKTRCRKSAQSSSFRRFLAVEPAGKIWLRSVQPGRLAPNRPLVCFLPDS
jgi:hypothetical protein